MGGGHSDFGFISNIFVKPILLGIGGHVPPSPPPPPVPAADPEN